MQVVVQRNGRPERVPRSARRVEVLLLHSALRRGVAELRSAQRVLQVLRSVRQPVVQLQRSPSKLWLWWLPADPACT